jgi:serine/threonine-protein kinase
LGVTFWEMLAMKRLFRRSSQTTIASAVLYDEIPPPSQHVPEILEGLDPIVLKALRRHPNDRWQTAHEMELAIRQVLHAQPQVIGPADLSEWMNDVFPFGEARKEQLVRMASVGSSEGAADEPATRERQR